MKLIPKSPVYNTFSMDIILINKEMRMANTLKDS